jgi:iron complex transport system substrate-binding protein
MKTKNKLLALAEIAIVLCSVFLVALPAIAADQNTQKTITTASEDDITLDIYGNANEDDTIDMRDTTYIKLVIFGKKPKTDLADANYDGKVSMLDVGQTKLIILGKEKKLTVLDLFDRTVTINKPVERMVLTFGFEEPIAVMGEDIFDKIVGWNRGYWENRRQWIWEKYTSAIPEIDDIPDVGYPSKGTLNIEKVVVLEPNVVIMSGFEYKYDDVWKKLEQAGIPTIFVDYHAETLEKHTKSTLMLGYVFDKEERAQELMDFYTEQIDMVYSRMDEIEDKTKPKVYIERSAGMPPTWATYDPKSIWGVLIKNAGGINIAEEGTKTISPEKVLDANPDVIIIAGKYNPKQPGVVKLGYYADIEESRELLKAYVDRPGWDTLRAIKNQRVYAVHHGLPRHICDFVALQYLAKSCYPDVFDDLDPEENFKEFHERFLPVDYSGVWMLSIEEE